MPIKLANNASAHLASPLAADGTTIVLVTSETGNFPALATGEWFPLTLADADGNLEIARITARSSNILTAVRAQEGTTALTWDAGDRAEIRMTAAVVDQLQADTEAAIDAAVAQASSDTVVALGALFPVGFGPLPWSRAAEPAGWIFCDGRTLTGATPYTALRAAYIADSFPYGQDGSGNPKVPDLRGRLPAGADNMGGSAANRLTAAGSGITGTTLGATGGAETHTLSTTQIPAHAHGVTDPTHAHGVSDPTHAHSVYDPTHTHGSPWMGSWSCDNEAPWYGLANPSNGFDNRAMVKDPSSSTISTYGAYTGISIYGAATGVTVQVAGSGISIQNAGGGAAHNNTQPTIVTNYIVKAA